MEKIKLTDLGLLPELSKTIIPLGNTEIEVTKKLPYEQILKMIEDVAAVVIDDRPFVSAPLEVITENLIMVKYYTNLDIDIFDKPFIEPQEVYETYDFIEAFNGFTLIKNQIDADQLSFFIDTVHTTLNSIVAYKNSVKGIIDDLAADAKNNSQAISEGLELLNNSDSFKEAKRFVEVFQENN